MLSGDPLLSLSLRDEGSLRVYRGLGGCCGIALLLSLSLSLSASRTIPACGDEGPSCSASTASA